MICGRREAVKPGLFVDPRFGHYSRAQGWWWSHIVQFLAVIFLGICAGLAIAKAVDARRWREVRRFWIYTGIAAPLVLATVIATWHFFAYPILPKRSSSGFGPDWTCTDPGHGELVCIKKPPSTAPESSD